jgi:hypothetical protein
VASLTSKSFNSSVQSIGTAKWLLCAGTTSATACTGSAAGPFTTSLNCAGTQNKTELSLTGGNVLTLNNGTNVKAGMIVTGTGITSSGINWVASIVGATVTLGIGASTQIINTPITFTTCTGQSTFLSLNNTGTAGISQVNLIDTVTVTGANTMKLQSCNTGGVGTTNLAWDEVNNLCVGQVNTIASITAATSPLTTTAYSMVIAAGGTASLRALSSQANKSITVSASVNSTNLTVTSRNG